MLGGSEIYDGVETRYGANWESLGQTLSVDLAAAVNDTDSGFAVLTTAEKDSLPSALVAPSGETYAQVEAVAGATGNSETTYYNESGTILGYSSTTVGEQPGPDGTPQQSSNTSYKDANREFIGSSFTDSYGTGFNTNETVSISAPVDIDLDGDGTAEFTISDASYPSSYRVETGGFTPTDTNESGSTNTHYFSSTGEHLGGMDVYGAQTTIYGANWNVTSTSTDTSQLTLTAVDTNVVPSEFLDAVAPNVGAATVTIAVTVDTPVGGTPTFLFDGSAIPADFSINEGDVYVFDTSDSSMDGFEIGFSTVANSAADALTTGVTVNGIPGTTGANTTLILPVEYGGVDGTGGQELHIIGKQAVMPNAETIDIVVTAGSPFSFVIDGNDVTTLDFVDGNTYVFDLSSATLADSTFGADTGNGNPVSIGLSTGADGAGTALTVTLSGTPGTAGATATYQHVGSATAGETIHIYGVDTGADPVATTDDLDIAGMQATGITTTQSAPVAVISVVDNMGTSGTGNGVVVTDMVREVQTSTETHSWGTETTYFFEGAVVGYSETQSGTAADMSGGSREVFYDADHNRVGEVYSDEYGSGSNFRFKLTEAVDIDGDGTNDFGTFTGNTTNETYFLVTNSNSEK